jgi:septum formation protein
MNDLIPYRLILASASPRRQQLLREMGLEFTVKVKPVDESFPEELTREKVALFLCEKKSDAFHDDEIGDNEVIITADTVVCLEDEILNKPADRREAVGMLEKLSGRRHEVITAICLRNIGKRKSFFVSTTVYFKSLSREEIVFYVDRYQPYDKAGSYGIQEWIGYTGIEKIQGSYFNVVGLPTARLYEELKRF